MTNSRVLKTLLGPIFCLLFLCPWLLGNAECNAFLGTADKTGDDALTYQAKQYIDSGDYTNALTSIAQLSTTRRNSHAGRVLEATAYAGKCGLNFLALADDVANQVGKGTKTLMAALLTEMKGATSYADCSSAETLLLGVATADMTSDDWIFLTFLEFAKIGAVLEVSADGSSHSGAVANGYDTCSTANISDLQVGEIGASINIALSSLAHSGVSLSGLNTSQFTTYCGSFNMCNNTTAASFVGNTFGLYALRTLIKANEMGLNTCGGASGSSAACTCP